MYKNREVCYVHKSCQDQLQERLQCTTSTLLLSSLKYNAYFVPKQVGLTASVSLRAAILKLSVDRLRLR